MNFVSCFDTVEIVVGEATKKLGTSWKLNNYSMDVLRQYCSKLDELVEEFDGFSIDVEVLPDTMQIRIVLECGELIIENKEHILYKLIERTDSFGFSPGKKPDNVRLELIFPSLWDEV